MKTFWIQIGYSARESLKIISYAKEIGCEVGWGTNHSTTDDLIPVGTVPYCESFLNYKPTPDFMPDWAKDYFHREIKIINTYIQWDNLGGEFFVKSASSYKEFPARIYLRNELLPKGRLLISDVVEFNQEWRYYVSNGKVLTTGWYDGNNENEPAPKIDIKYPDDYCGAVDFGRLVTGEIALVEAQDPYACGWYGDDHEAYAQWLLDGWEYMKAKK